MPFPPNKVNCVEFHKRRSKTMQIDFKNETLPISELKWTRSVTLMAEGDVIVPDIKPDICEILLTEAHPVINSQSLSGDKLSISGTVTVHIVYLPEPNGLPKSIQTKFDFHDTLDLPDGEPLNINVKASAEHIEFSLINSRKLNIKTAISLSAHGYKKQELTLLTDVHPDSPLKIRKKHLTTFQVVADTKRELMITESLEVPSAKPDIDEIIRLCVKPLKGDCKISAGCILLKGNLLIDTLYCGLDADAGVQHMEHDLSFSELQEVEGLDEDCLCNVTYDVKNIYYSVKEDANGEDRIINLDVVLQADITASKTQSIEIIDDCYSTAGIAQLQTERKLLDELLIEGISHESIKEILTVPEEVPAAGAVYSLHCKPRITEVSIVDETIRVQGKLAAFVLYGCVDADTPMYSLIGEFDFSHIIPVEGIDASAICECGVTEQGVSFTLNAFN
ncbi:MAG: DUF3794 domain-containing protein, partial [Ruminococcaceae bacterium]|nr:DUF3794 domain-containing protein [Oscillospiraceae bacterium]